MHWQDSLSHEIQGLLLRLQITALLTENQQIIQTPPFRFSHLVTTHYDCHIIGNFWRNVISEDLLLELFILVWFC